MVIQTRMKRVKMKAIRWGWFDEKRVGLDHLPAATGRLLASSVTNNKVGRQRLHMGFLGELSCPAIEPNHLAIAPGGAIRPVEAL